MPRLQPLAPFRESFGDLVLTSADDVEFRVYSQILIAASPVLGERIATARSRTDEHSFSSDSYDRPPLHITLTEDSNTLDGLLRLCYPIEKPEHAWSHRELSLLLEASLKYKMSWPITLLVKKLVASAVTRPLQVWACGCRLGLERVARAGAEGALQFTELGTYGRMREFIPAEQFVRDIRGVTAGDYFRLLDFHKRGGSVSVSFALTNAVGTSGDGPGRGTYGDGAYTLVGGFYDSLLYHDIACRSSDGRDFHVHKGLLCMCSPALSDRIKELSELGDIDGDAANCDPSSSGCSTIPTLHLAEEGELLAVLLRLCYPGEHTLPESLSFLLALQQAAEKYEMTRVVDQIKARWALLAKRNPLSAYFIASGANLHEEAKAAAKNTVHMDLSAQYVAEMEDVSAQVYQRLLNFQRERPGRRVDFDMNMSM
ncbi:hypothetical protein C8Q78DRAFT_347938 [Trametes maxima]|nr:hypothetical protein C8Q78DRAFT_347938 [Trametes maxima]